MRHPLHSLCPYFAMFPEQFVAKHLLAYTERGDVVFDPFCGRGTAIFESLLNGRNAAGLDINPVAACVAGAKADPPTLSAVIERLHELEFQYTAPDVRRLPHPEFFRKCFHPRTFREVLYLREKLKWKRSKVDRFVAAVLLGVLHGESHKSENCLSNRMPRTISTKPGYSVRWWSLKGLVAPERATFEIVRRMSAFRLSQAVAQIRGKVKCQDVRRASVTFPELRGKVKLMITSPPYLDTTDFREDQWLRLWFLGGPHRPSWMKSDDRHTNVGRYWNFLSEAWNGCAALLRPGAIIIVRIGGTSVPKEELAEGLKSSLLHGLEALSIKQLHDGLTTEIKNRQTSAFRPGTSSSRYEHDFAFQLR